MGNTNGDCGNKDCPYYGVDHKHGNGLSDSEYIYIYEHNSLDHGLNEINKQRMKDYFNKLVNLSNSLNKNKK